VLEHPDYYRLRDELLAFLDDGAQEASSTLAAAS
jgi:hypothetical protein